MTTRTAHITSASTGAAFTLTKRFRADAPSDATHPFVYEVTTQWKTTTYGLLALADGLVARFGMDEAEADAIAVEFAYRDTPSFYPPVAKTYPSFYNN